MAEGDPLAPSQYPGQWWGLSNPYAGLDQNDPLFQYTFDPFSDPAYAVMFGPEAGPFAQFAGIQANFDPSLEGNVEQMPQTSDPLQLFGPNMDILQSQLNAQSTGLAPLPGNVPTTAPWAAAPQPGALQSEAGFGDIGGTLGGF